MNKLNFRFAQMSDVDLYFKWTNDSQVRQNSLNSNDVDIKDHIAWFTRKVNNPDVSMYLFLDSDKVPVGQVIIEKKEDGVILGQSVAREHRGKKYSTEMLTKSTDDYLVHFPQETILSVVKGSNIASIKMSKNSGFNQVQSKSTDENVLVLKGFQQNDEDFIKKAKKLYNII
jgi:RimJ/RimL family protein N-acetyltransferase